MASAPVGAVVRIFYDGHRLEPGDALVTTAGRTYIIAAVRRQARGKHVGRQHLACLVARPEGPPTDSRAYPLRWYRREARHG